MLCDFLSSGYTDLLLLTVTVKEKRGWVSLRLIQKSRSYRYYYTSCVFVCIFIYLSGAATSPSLSLELCISTTQVCIGVSFTTASFQLPIYSFKWWSARSTSFHFGNICGAKWPRLWRFGAAPPRDHLAVEPSGPHWDVGLIWLLAFCWRKSLWRMNAGARGQI